MQWEQIFNEVMNQVEGVTQGQEAITGDMAGDEVEGHGEPNQLQEDHGVVTQENEAPAESMI